jgi:predicted PurR-regulated permease PerM
LLSQVSLPAPPSWVEALPVIGAKVAARWRDIAAGGPTELESLLRPYVQQFGGWALRQVSTVAVLLFHLLLTLVIVVILYMHGEDAAHGALGFARRLAGVRGESSVRLAAQAIRSVALGIILTALAQSLLSTIGLATAGFRNSAALGVLTFMLCVAQLGPGLVLVPAVIWLYWSGEAGWGTALLVWSVPVVVLDNVMRPILIRRGADLPLLLIFAGVIGGLIAFGIIGLFIGPVVLAVGYTLAVAWVQEAVPDEDHGASPDPVPPPH